MSYTNTIIQSLNIINPKMFDVEQMIIIEKELEKKLEEKEK